MALKQNTIVIPIHKAQPDKWEKLSFEQCCSVLGSHPICIATHADVDISVYHEIAKKHNIYINKELFDASFFASIAGYNRLMLDKRFYQRFAQYQYMLIYQLDAWVFRDELDKWCAKGFDYIGAPWTEEDNQGNTVFAGVGNGGFSLRRVQHFVDVLSYKGPVRKASQLKLSPTLKNIFYSFFYNLGYQNTLSYYKKDETLYEDIFLSIYLDDTKLCANVPDAIIAARFAFEKSPSFLYSKIKHLPFGCHAWRKYEYNAFWKDLIPSIL